MGLDWSRGLTKETDIRVKHLSESLKKTRKNPEKYKNWKPHLLKLPSPEFVRKIYWEDKLTQKEIAVFYGVCQGAVSQFMKYHKIPNRGKGEGLKRRTSPPEVIHKKISRAMMGNNNWRFSHGFPNGDEKKMIEFFAKYNLAFRYVGDGSFKLGSKYPDFVNSEHKKVIEFFGDFWHKSSDEEERKAYFGELGWGCLVVWGKDIRRNGWKERLFKRLEDAGFAKLLRRRRRV